MLLHFWDRSRKRKQSHLQAGDLVRFRSLAGEWFLWRLPEMPPASQKRKKMSHSGLDAAGRLMANSQTGKGGWP